MRGLTFAAPAATDRITLADTATTTTSFWQAFTIAAWVYMNSDSDPNFLFSKCPAGDAAMNIYWRFNGGINVFVNRATVNCEIQTNSSQYTLSTLMFLAVTFSAAGGTAATTINVYVGYPGTPVAEVAYTARIQGSGAASAVTGSLFAGNRTAPYSKSLDGNIYDFQAINRYLSVEEVEQLRQASEEDLMVPGTVIYWPCGRDGVATQYDYSGNGNNGTITGAALADGALSRPFPIQDPYYIQTATVYAQSVAGALAPAGALARQTGKVVAGAAGFAGTLARLTSAARAGALTPAGALIRQTQQSQAGAAAPSGALLKQTAVSPSGALTPAGGLLRRVGQLLVGALTPGSETVKQTQTSMSGSVTPTGTAALIKTILLAVSGTLAPAGGLLKQTAVSALGALAPAGALIKQVSNSLSGAVTPAGAVAGVRAILLAVGGTLAPAGSLQRAVASSLAGALAPAGSVVKRVAHGLGGSLASSGAVSAVIAGVAKVRATFRGMWRGMRRGS